MPTNAERYEFLRRQTQVARQFCETLGPHVVVATNQYGDGYTPNSPQMLDKAIDDALAQEREHMRKKIERDSDIPSDAGSTGQDA